MIMQRRRSIPAWAGEPVFRTKCPSPQTAVYPRVGGGTRRALHRGQPARLGLSPRGRGNPSRGYQHQESLATTVYPRVGGGTVVALTHPLTVNGLSPRGRGNPLYSIFSGCARTVYPRVGGGTRPSNSQRLRQSVGSIPAWAGEPYSHTCSLTAAYSFYGLSPRGRGNHTAASAMDIAVRLTRVYPRVGGGTPST